MAKSLEQWRDELESASCDARAIRLELVTARLMQEDPFDLLELEVAYRNALARLHERQRRYRAAMTVRGKRGTK